MIKERPILFSAPMVQALLADKKTQTRRRVKKLSDFSPYGRIGDRLWVRETTQEDSVGSISLSRYSADNSLIASDGGTYAQPVEWWYSRSKCPAIHLPRRFSRILLEITEVRLEQLQDISETDAVAEGIDGFNHPDPYASYKTLWEKINGTASWNSNPWVWVIEFKRVSDAT